MSIEQQIGEAAPYGTAMGLYFHSVGLKGFNFYSEPTNENK